MAQSNIRGGVVITAIDAKTSVGPDIITSAAAIRAGACGFREHPEYYPIQKEEEEEDEYLISAGLDPSVKGFSWHRLIQSLEKPFLSFIAQTGIEREKFKDGAIWFALPDADPVMQKIGLQQHFLPYFINYFGLPNTGNFTAVQYGASGTGYLINKAREVLLSGEVEFLIIIAIDSFMIDGRMNHYDEQWRLKSTRSPMGFTPGEASALLLLETETNSELEKRATLLKISGVGIGQEKNPITGNHSSTGEGLYQAIEQALCESEQQLVRWLYSDLNGESYRAYEWGIVNIRLNGKFVNELVHEHPADVIGDVGAAGAALQLGCISEAFKNDYAIDQSALVIAASDQGQRVALNVSHPDL